MGAHAGVKPRFFDLVLIAALLLLACLWWVRGAVGVEDPSLVRIYNAQGLYREAPLQEDARISVPGPLGESVVEVCSGRVSMAFSPCPDRLCMRAGAISKAGESIICVPNRVCVMLSAQGNETDAVSY